MTNSPKLALCVKTEEFIQSQSHDRGWLQNLEYTIEDRATCETDPTLQQVIPYIVLVDRKTNRVLTYRRGQGGGENRLHGLYSIGFGGPVQSASGSLMNTLKESVTALLEEKVGVDLGGMLNHALVETETCTLRYPPYKLLHAQQLQLERHQVSDKDRARIGVVCVLETNSADFTTFEKFSDTHTEWRSMPWLQSLADEDSSNAKLESWSKFIISTGMIRALRNQNSLQKLAKAA